MSTDRQDIVNEIFARLLDEGAVARDGVDAALAAEGQPPTTTAEWCAATGEPTPLERRFGPGLTERQYALLEALFDLATGGGLGPHEGDLDPSVLNAVLARRDHGPATRAEVLAALRRSAEALETRRRRTAAIWRSCARSATSPARSASSPDAPSSPPSIAPASAHAG